MFILTWGAFLTLVRVVMAIAVLARGGTSKAQEQNGSWTAMAGGSWGDSTNNKWQDNLIASGANSTATFNLDFISNSSVTLDGDRTIGSITTSSANPWTITAGSPAGVLMVANVTVTGDGPLTISAAMSGDNFNKAGDGKLILSNSTSGSNYSGVINISGGTLALTGAGDYSTGSNTVHVGPGATLDVTTLTAGPQYGESPNTRLVVHDGDTLDGTGTVKGGLKVKSGGTVYPGVNGLGTLNVDGNAEFAAGSKWKVKLGTDMSSMPTSNVLAITKDLTLGDDAAHPMNMLIDGAGQTFIVGHPYDYFIGTIPIAQSVTINAVAFVPSNIDPALYASPSAFSLSRSGNDLILTFTPVPEPAMTGLVLAAGVAAAGWWRRRRTRLHQPEAGLARPGITS